MSCLRVSHVVKPLNFTNFTIRELQNQYCVSDYQFWTHGLYFFHHFLPHPQKLNKLNKDMTQKSRDRSVECCLWKRCGDKIASVKSRWGGGDVGQRVTYKLYERLITGRETQIGYKLDAYMMMPDEYDADTGQRAAHKVRGLFFRC